MEFGNRERFSIAVELDKNSGGKWMFGKICYWVSGEAIGNYDLGASLRDVLFVMTDILRYKNNRTCPKLLQLPDYEIVSLISSAIDEESSDIDEYLRGEIFPASFDVCIPVDVFNEWKIFLVSGGDMEKIFCYNLLSKELKLSTLGIGEFDSVFEAAYLYLDGIYQPFEQGKEG